MKEFKEGGYPAEKYPRVKGGPIKELNAYLKEPVREGWEYGDALWKK